MDNILNMRNISKTFPGVKALDNVSFEVRTGEIHCLIGANGAGKSTLMNVLMGIYRQEDGEVWFNGQKCTISSPVEAFRKGIGMVPQELNLVPDLTVAENVFLGNERIRNGRINWKETYSKAQELMVQFGAPIDVRAKAGSFSAAYQQIIQITRCIAMGAQLLILDEPTASLTSAEVELLFANMRKLKEMNKSIIFISHHLDEIKEIGDRVSIMRDGMMIATKGISEISTDEMIRYMTNTDTVGGRERRNYQNKGCKLKIENYCRKNEFTNISFEVGAGEIFGIGGLVGAGRTELFNAIYGITARDSGVMYLDGREVNITCPQDAIRLGIGYVPEERRKEGIFPILSVRENLTMPLLKKLCGALGLKLKSTEKIAKEYVDKLSVKTPSTETPIASLSGGNQQKVVLAKWLAKKVDILMLDEPTRGIDVGAKREIHDLLISLAEQGMTILVVSSEMDELIEISDRIMIMHEGQMKGIVYGGSTSKEEMLKTALS